MFVLLRAKKSTFKTIPMLILVSKKVSLKNQTLFRVFWSKKLVEVILSISNTKLSIFLAPILVSPGLSSNLAE